MKSVNQCELPCGGSGRVGKEKGHDAFPTPPPTLQNYLARGYPESYWKMRDGIKLPKGEELSLIPLCLPCTTPVPVRSRCSIRIY